MSGNDQTRIEDFFGGGAPRGSQQPPAPQPQQPPAPQPQQPPARDPGFGARQVLPPLGGGAGPGSPNGGRPPAGDGGPLRDEELDEVLRRAGDNPMVTCALPLIDLAKALSTELNFSGVETLKARVLETYKSYLKALRDARFPEENYQLAGFMVASFVDEMLSNTAWGWDNWSGAGLCMEVFGVPNGGDQFFDIVEEAKSRGREGRPLLELAHAVLALGFRGKLYREGDADRLKLVREELRRLVSRKHPDQTDFDLSPQWRGLSIGLGRFRRRVPPWIIPSLCLALLVGLYVLLHAELGHAADDRAAQVAALVPDQPVQIVRSEVARPVETPTPAAVPTPAPLIAPPVSQPTPIPPPAQAIARPVEAPPIAQVVQPPTNRSTLLQRIQSNVPEVTAFHVGNRGAVRVLVPSDTMFAVLSDQVADDARKMIVRLGEQLKGEEVTLLVEGHTDAQRIRPGRARFASNQELSEARAAAVQVILAQTLAVSPNDIRTAGLAATKPLCPNINIRLRVGDQTQDIRDWPTCHARNRRVELLVYPKGLGVAAPAPTP